MTKSHGPPLCWSRLQARLHGCNFLTTKSLLLKSDMTKRVPKASPGVHREKQPPPGVSSEQEPSGSASSGIWSLVRAQVEPSSAQSTVSFCVLQGKTLSCPSFWAFSSKDCSKWPRTVPIPAVSVPRLSRYLQRDCHSGATSLT